MPTANWILTPARENLPMLSLGTSSDRIGSPEATHAYYLTAAKPIPQWHIAPYLSVNYSEKDHGINYPFGVNIPLARHWDLLPMNDGRRSHLILTYKEKSYNISLMAVYMSRVGLSVGFSF